MQFEFATAGRILFGAGALRELGPPARNLGQRALLVTGRSRKRAEQTQQILEAQGVACVCFEVPHEPTTELVARGAAFARHEACDLVVGFGGGSVLDAAKAISALMTHEGEVLDYLEVVGRGKALTKPCASWIAVPTTAGTGAEVTRNAVLASPAHRMKVSLRSPYLLPKLAIVDPELTQDLPPALTAATGLDALTQLIEPYVSVRANPLTDGFCLEGMRRAARSLRQAFENGLDRNAREDMALASLLGGLALGNAGLGAVHGFASPLGGMFDAPHGALCAALLPHVMEVNVRALAAREPEARSLRRYHEIARRLTGQPAATAADGVKWVGDLCRALRVSSLRSHGVGAPDLPEIVEKAAQASSMRGNPIVLTPDEMREILTAAW